MAQARLDDGLDPKVLSAPAALMTAEEDWAIFRRFDEFNLLNLLILQNEVQKLTSQLKQLYPQATEDGNKTPNVWYMLAHPLAINSAPTPQTQAQEDLEAKRNEVWKNLKKKLKEYSEPRKLYPPRFWVQRIQ
jgi:hypothetical protein